MSWHRVGKGGTRYWGLQGAGILFTDGKSILVLKRNEPTDRHDSWSIPGGKTEEGESAIGTAIRETKEETGIGDIPGTRFASFDSKDGQHRFTTFLYRVDEPFPVKLSNEHSSWRWVPFNDLQDNDLELHPRFEEALPDLLRLIRKKGRIASFQEWSALHRMESSWAEMHQP